MPVFQIGTNSFIFTCFDRSQFGEVALRLLLHRHVHARELCAAEYKTDNPISALPKGNDGSKPLLGLGLAWFKGRLLGSVVEPHRRDRIAERSGSQLAEWQGLDIRSHEIPIIAI